MGPDIIERLKASA